MGEEGDREKEMELHEREAVLITREQMLEQRIREILRREQLVAMKEEHIEDLLRQLQSLGLHEVAAGLEDTFEKAIKGLEGRGKAREQAPEEAPEGADSLSDGGIGSNGLWSKSVEMRRAREDLMLELIDEPGLDPEERSRRLLERLDRELDTRNSSEVWERADRMRYLASTFSQAGNYSKSAEYARRALIILGEFA